MPNTIHLQPGSIFGRLTVVSRCENKNGFARYECKCACGAEVISKGAYLNNGNTRSCGCLRRDSARGNRHAYKHGHAPNAKGGRRPSRTYRSWDSMINRCLNPNDPFYSHYGERGITVCARWRASFVNFLADMGERPTGRTLDRIDNDGNYEPGNCRWATPKEQIANQRPRKERAKR